MQSSFWEQENSGGAFGCRRFLFSQGKREMDPLQGLIGVKLTHLIAGIAGGMVRALLAGGGWMAAMTSVIVGSLTAGYLTTPVYSAAKSWFPAVGHDISSEHATSFLVGLTAMLLCEGVLRAARGWSKNPKLPNGKP